MQQRQTTQEEHSSSVRVEQQTSMDLSMTEEKSKKMKNCLRLRKASLVCLIVGVIVIILFIWVKEQSTHEVLKKQLQEAKKHLSELQNKNKQQESKILHIEAMTNAIIQLIPNSTNLPVESTQGSQEGGQNRTKIQEQQPLKNQLYIVNEKQPQQGGIKPRQLGTVSVIKYLSTNQKGQTVDQVLYPNIKIRDDRRQFHLNRKEFIKKFPYLQGLHLIAYNNKINRDDQQKEQKQLNEDYTRSDKVHNLEQYPEELPICILTPSYKNNANFRIQYNLNSIFTQNYSNYFAVITEDASGDGSDQVFRKYFQFYRIPTNKYVYISNSHKKGAMENDYIANTQYCSQDAISLHLDGDDELIGKNVFKIFNAEYQKLKAGALFSNFYFYNQHGYASNGFSSDFSPQTKKENTYRSQGWHSSHLKTYRTQLFRGIDKSNFLDKNGIFFTFASDLAYYFPVMQSACGRVHQIQGTHYLYNTGTGNNEDSISRSNQMAAQRQIRQKPIQKCNEVFKSQMEKGV